MDDVVDDVVDGGWMEKKRRGRKREVRGTVEYRVTATGERERSGKRAFEAWIRFLSSSGWNPAVAATALPYSVLTSLCPLSSLFREAGNGVRRTRAERGSSQPNTANNQSRCGNCGRDWRNGLLDPVYPAHTVTVLYCTRHMPSMQTGPSAVTRIMNEESLYCSYHDQWPLPIVRGGSTVLNCIDVKTQAGYTLHHATEYSIRVVVLLGHE